MGAADRNGLALAGMRLVGPLLGLSAIAWAVSVLPVFHINSYVAMTAARVISGDRFRNEVWKSIDLKSRDLPYEAVKPSLLAKLAVLRLRSVETTPPGESSQEVQSRLQELAELTKDALRNTPTDGFLWLTLCWISDRSGTATNDRWRFLRSSYQMSRNEGWIGLKRNPFVLGHFATLPDDIAEDAVQELMHLVRSGLHAEAAQIISGPGLPINKLLLPRLRALGIADRTALARSLSTRDGFEDVARELDVESPAPDR